MILAAVVAEHEGALVCDFAQFYHVLDWRALPLSLSATLAAGLPNESRTKMQLAGVCVPLDSLLLAGMHDRLSYLVWAQTEDARRNKNRPASVAAVFCTQREDETDGLAFSSGAAFDAYRARMMGV